jgi:hypothetical protein
VNLNFFIKRKVVQFESFYDLAKFENFWIRGVIVFVFYKFKVVKY